MHESYIEIECNDDNNRLEASMSISSYYNGSDFEDLPDDEISYELEELYE